MTGRFPASLAILLALVSGAAAQDADQSQGSGERAADIGPDAEIIDEVTVLGVRELASLRADVIRAEDVVYDLYNELNDDDRYDIICKKETRIGSQIPRRVCLSRLYRDAVSEASEEVLDGSDVGTIGVNSARHNAILRERMAALANQHPELLAALKKRLELKKKLEQERAKKFD